ncbi:MAG: chlorohydrolase family protein [Thermaerobacterales bacterium]
MKTKLKGRYVVGFDAAQKQHVVYENGELVFEDDRVLFAGKTYTEPVDKVIDATSCIISPGFVDVHALMDVGINALILDKGKGEGMYRPHEWVMDPDETPVFTPQEVKAGSEQTFLALLRSGATTFCGITAMVFKRWDDPVWEPEVHVETAMRYGLRAYIPHHYRTGARYVKPDGSDGWVWDEERGLRGLERSVEFIKKFDGAFEGRIGSFLFPYTSDQSSVDLLNETRRQADELGVRIKMHFAQSLFEVEEIGAQHNGLTPVEFLDSLNFLGPDVMLTHCTYGRGHQGGPWVSDEELDILAGRQVSVGHTPWIYSMRGGYLNSLTRYLNRGVNVCLGTDTHPNDMIREMLIAAIMCKTAEGGDATAGTAREVYNAATLNGARFLGRDDLGRLAPGSKADIVAVDLERAAIGPHHDPIRSLVYFSSLADVKHVFVDGRHLVKDGAAAGIDEEEVIRRAQPVADKLRGTMVGWDRQGRSEAELYPTSFEIR